MVGSSCAKGVLRDLLSTWRFRTQRRVPRDRSVRLLGSSAGLLQDVQTVMAIDVAITEYDVVDLRYVTFRSADASDVVAPEMYEDETYPLLSGIDPYGDTVFNSLQMPRLVKELERRFESMETSPERRRVGEVLAWRESVSTRRPRAYTLRSSATKTAPRPLIASRHALSNIAGTIGERRGATGWRTLGFSPLARPRMFGSSVQSFFTISCRTSPPGGPHRYPAHFCAISSSAILR